MTTEELAEIEKRLEAATPGPWFESHDDLCYRPPHGGVSPVIIRGDNRKFIVNTPTDIRRLIDEVKRLQYRYEGSHSTSPR